MITLRFSVPRGAKNKDHTKQMLSQVGLPEREWRAVARTEVGGVVEKVVSINLRSRSECQAGSVPRHACTTQ